jgi:hypothetical protein
MKQSKDLSLTTNTIYYMYTKVASTSDSMWANAWRGVYLGPYGASLRVPWHPIFGNRKLLVA